MLIVNKSNFDLDGFKEGKVAVKVETKYDHLDFINYIFNIEGMVVYENKKSWLGKWDSLFSFYPEQAVIGISSGLCYSNQRDWEEDNYEIVSWKRNYGRNSYEVDSADKYKINDYSQMNTKELEEVLKSIEESKIKIIKLIESKKKKPSDIFIPEKGEEFYYVNSFLDVCGGEYKEEYDVIVLTGNSYETEEEAQAEMELQLLTTRIRTWAYEKGYLFNKKNIGKSDVYYIYVDLYELWDNGSFPDVLTPEVFGRFIVKSIIDVYFSEEEYVEEAIEEFGQEIVEVLKKKFSVE